jgi:UDP-N-acetylmuramoyl-L-alanyl-D-glutamate--2,6-diaminopimelate ligase
MATVAEIAARIPGAAVVGDGTVEPTGMTEDSRTVEPGFLFAAVKGARADGARFIDEAVAAGAVAVLAERPVAAGVPCIVVHDPRAALGPAAATCYGDPTRVLGLIGVTGTNGKTTVSYLVEAALVAAGQRPGVMGTVEYRFEKRRWNAAHTTPEAPVIQSMARRMLDLGATHLVLEVSSHGLALGRLGGSVFDVVAFTNLTQDHLDFHETMEEYAAAKLLLFTSVLTGNPAARAVVNLDDPFARTILARLAHPALTVSLEPGGAGDIRPAQSPCYGIDGIDAPIRTPAGTVPLNTPLLGAHNLSNLLVALGIGLQLGLDPREVAAGLSGVRAVPGRLERVENDGEFAVLVDYAHTPDALARVLAALRPLTAGRLMVVFGCGGDRDRAKRPLMGAAVAWGADLAVVTSDNPRTEDADSIIGMILPGLAGAGVRPVAVDGLAYAPDGFVVERDRATAIRLAVRAARPGDTVLVAGKGHEDYQILGTRRIHFDDREQVREALAARGGEGGGGG